MTQRKATSLISDKSAKPEQSKEKDVSQVQGNEADTEDEVRDEEIHAPSVKCSRFVTQRQFEKSTGEVRYSEDGDPQSKTDMWHVVLGMLCLASWLKILKN